MMATLTKMGMSTKKGNTMEGIIIKEAESVCDILGGLAVDGPVQMRHKFPPAMNNVVMNLTTGRQTA